MTWIRIFFLETLRIVLPLAVIAAGVGGFLVLGQRKSPPVRPVAEKVPTVNTTSPAKHTAGLEISVDGVVVPYRQVTLAAEVGGTIKTKLEECRPGRYVTKGQELMTIDKSDYKIQEDQSKAEKEQAEANLKEQQVELASTDKLLPIAEQLWNLQKSEVRRALRLRGETAASAADVEKAQQAELSARNTLQTLKNQKEQIKVRQKRLRTAIRVAEAKLKKAGLDLARTTIRAPLTGVVVKCPIEEDTHVQKGMELVTIQDISKVEVVCKLRMKDLAWLWQPGDANRKPGDQKDYKLPSAPVEVVYHVGQQEYIWQGVLSRFDGIGVDERTRTLPCRILVNKPNNVKVARETSVSTSQAAGRRKPPSKTERFAGGPPVLMRGMFVTVRILAKPSISLLRLPERALRPGNVVWRIKNNKLDVVPVDVARIQDGMVILRAATAPLSYDDRIILTPLGDAFDGMKIQEGKHQ